MQKKYVRFIRYPSNRLFFGTVCEECYDAIRTKRHAVLEIHEKRYCRVCKMLKSYIAWNKQFPDEHHPLLHRDAHNILLGSAEEIEKQKRECKSKQMKEVWRTKREVMVKAIRDGKHKVQKKSRSAPSVANTLNIRIQIPEINMSIEIPVFIKTFINELKRVIKKILKGGVI